jgi:biotin operon repressor
LKSYIGNNQKLTKKESEVLDLMNSNSYTKEDIANRLKISKSMLYRYMRKLNKKGWEISSGNERSQKRVHVSPKSKLWRYHNLHFVIKPYYFFPRYKKLIGSMEIKHGSWLVSLHRNVIEFQ